MSFVAVLTAINGFCVYVYGSVHVCVCGCKFKELRGQMSMCLSMGVTLCVYIYMCVFRCVLAYAYVCSFLYGLCRVRCCVCASLRIGVFMFLGFYVYSVGVYVFV